MWTKTASLPPNTAFPSIPCLVVLKNGQESARSVGFLPKQALQDMLDKYI